MTVRTFALAAIMAAGALLAPAAPAGAQSLHIALAPANEYFGRMRLSIAEIRNSINRLRVESTNPAFTAKAVRARVALVDEALTDWARKYPRDPIALKYRAELSSLSARLSFMR